MRTIDADAYQKRLIELEQRARKDGVTQFADSFQFVREDMQRRVWEVRTSQEAADRAAIIQFFEDFGQYCNDRDMCRNCQLQPLCDRVKGVVPRMIAEMLV